MNRQSKYILILSVPIIFGFSFHLTEAKDLTSPLRKLPLIIHSYFDHSKPGYLGSKPIVDNNITIYTTEVGTKTNGVCRSLPGGIFDYYTKPNKGGRCISYDGHNGADFRASKGDDVLSVASGVIQSATFDRCNGRMIRVWHPNLGYSTLYTHLDRFIKTSGNVKRSELIAKSGNSGSNCTTGPHLHFGVRDAQTGGNAIDPYGWQGTGQDPWPYNKGYLWTTDPPSLKPPATYVSGFITKNTTWTKDKNPYVVQGSVTVNSGVTLTIDPGVIVKFEDKAYMNVNGNLIAEGGPPPSAKIHFTSIKDDSVGGDTNGDGDKTKPAPGDYGGIYFKTNSKGNFNASTFRYGGSYITEGSGVIEIEKGNVIFNDSVFMNNDNLINFKWYSGGFLSIKSSTITNNSSGLMASVSTSTTLELINNKIGYNKHKWGDVHIAGPVNFINSGNSAIGTSSPSIWLSGTLFKDQIWNYGIPFVLRGVSVGLGKKLVINPGVIVKDSKDSNESFNVFGSIFVPGTKDKKVYFTSIKDDSVGGDTNGDGDKTKPAPGDYFGFSFKDKSKGEFNNASFRYGGSGGSSGGVVSVSNGNLQVKDSEFRNNIYGIYQKNGFSSVTSSEFIDNDDYGIYFSAFTINTLSVTKSKFGSHKKADVYISGPVNFVNQDNSAANTDIRGFRISGNIFKDQIWNPGIPFVVGNNLSWSIKVDSGKILTISPGTVVKFHYPNAFLAIDGKLNAKGDSWNKIYFTSIRDDSVGGDTNGDINTTRPSSQDYLGLLFNSNSIGIIDNSVLRYGGNRCDWYCNAVIRNYGGNLNISNTKIANNAYGIYQKSGNTKISQSSIYNTQNFYGIYNAGSNIIKATNNYWGHSTGPYHPQLNPNGKGDTISDNVNFKPWLKNPPGYVPPTTFCNGC